MSGHSKWATTKHRKAAVDSKRSNVFTKIIREMTTAARIGGGDPEGNARLRTAILKAKEANMPAENIKRAIQKGTGELPGVAYEEITYEGYGPGGVALLIHIMTENKNRTAPEIRHLLSKHGGNLGEAGSVSWMFEKKGYMTFPKRKTNEDQLMTVALDAGAEDIRSGDPENYEVITLPTDFEKIKKTLADAKFDPAFSEITYLPQSTVRLEEKDAGQMIKIMEALEDHDDVQSVSANFDIPDDIMEKITT
ncbi:MAG: YebC/PmpR family DNA-binding transcriptional regulator [Nitrospirae bacterium]|nr:YebC/PmpR family DNA-binding transcriptional regulator [Candidatus Troglogloeales bacterium]